MPSVKFIDRNGYHGRFVSGRSLFPSLTSQGSAIAIGRRSAVGTANHSKHVELGGLDYLQLFNEVGTVGRRPPGPLW